MSSSISSFKADFDELATQYPKKIALLDHLGRTITYQDLAEQVKQASVWLGSTPLEPGDCFIALMPNAIETVIIFLASLQGGYTYVPLPCTSTRTEVDHWKNLTRAKVCLLAHPVHFSLQAEIIKMDWPVKVIDIGETMPWSSYPSNHPFDAANEGRLVMASSGSTGEPKAILLDSNRLWSAGKAFLRYHQLTTDDIRFWNYLPMSYLGGLFNLTLIPLAAGGSLFIDDVFNGKTFLTFWSTIERFNINSLWLVPTVMRGLLTMYDRVHQKRPQPEIHRCYLGTAPVSLAEKQRFYEVFGIQTLENYGLSETTFISSENLQTISQRTQGSVGAVMPDVEIKLVPTIHAEVYATEIWVRTPYRMLGYLEKNQVNETVVDSDGFFPTGDFGQLVHGQLELTGRRRDIIKKGGVLVALREIELMTESYLGVVEAIAVAVEHDFYGESCVLYVRTARTLLNPEPFLSQLTTWLHSQLVRQKWPERIEYREDFPRTSSGKIQKHLLGACAHA